MVQANHPKVIIPRKGHIGLESQNVEAIAPRKTAADYVGRRHVLPHRLHLGMIPRPRGSNVLPAGSLPGAPSHPLIGNRRPRIQVVDRTSELKQTHFHGLGRNGRSTVAEFGQRKPS